MTPYCLHSEFREGLSNCHGLNDNGPSRLKYLNAWSPVVRTIWKGLGGGLVGGGVLLGMGFEVFKAYRIPLA